MLRLYNTLTHRKQIFSPLRGRTVTLYTCGPTVYDYVHIGNLRAYLLGDILKRTLDLAGYRVRHVMNITDVGHLTSQADTGEDKIALAARRQRKTAWEIARFYEARAKEDMRKLNILPPGLWARATEHIREQIALIRTLERKGYTYEIPGDGIYFDTARLRGYGELMPSRLKGIRAGARIEMIPGKRHPTDFALWKFSPPDVKRDMEWASPWGRGFPGWHIECSAMSMKYLGRTIDIHTGGIDLIPIHHTNEIAQSEAASGKLFVRFWLHGEFLKVEGRRMGKSEGNLVTLDELSSRGFDPLDFRYFVLTAHYRTPLNFTWKALAGARKALESLREFTQEAGGATKPTSSWNKVEGAFFDDLNTPKALALLWGELRRARKRAVGRAVGEARALLQEADKVLGLKLTGPRPKKVAIPSTVQALVAKREELREARRWQEADRLRERIKKYGFTVEDTSTGPQLKKIAQTLTLR